MNASLPSALALFDVHHEEIARLDFAHRVCVCVCMARADVYVYMCVYVARARMCVCVYFLYV